MCNGAALVQCYGFNNCPQMLDTWTLIYEEVMYADTPTQSHKLENVMHILSHLKLLGVER